MMSISRRKKKRKGNEKDKEETGKEHVKET
jgi:hypothetical protein